MVRCKCPVMAIILMIILSLGDNAVYPLEFLPIRNGFCALFLDGGEATQAEQAVHEDTRNQPTNFHKVEIWDVATIFL
jgi:hypothetical protein